MKKTLLIVTISTLAVLTFSAQALGAKPDFLAAKITNPVTGEPKNTVTLPAKAVEVAPNIFYLGMATENGKKVEGYAFVDYRKGYGKPGTVCGNGVCEKGENAKKCPADCGGGSEPNGSSCYGFLSRGAKWKALEDYIVDPANMVELDEAFVSTNLAGDIDKWEDAAGKDILGIEIVGTVDGADTTSPDNKNEVYFADIAEPGAIGITIVWGIFSGPPRGRELVEWDQVYDDVDFDWSSSGEAGEMDFESIATHELGHSVGLDDLYTSECVEQTMYGYASEGETEKRTLEAGDIAGVSKLYR